MNGSYSYISDVVWRLLLCALGNEWAAETLSEIRSLPEIVLPDGFAS